MSNFQSRHIGPSDKEIQEMLNVTENDSVSSLINKTIPSHIRLESELNVEKAKLSPSATLNYSKTENKINTLDFSCIS